MNKLVYLVFFTFLVSCAPTAKFPVRDYGVNIPPSMMDTSEYLVSPGDRLVIQSFNNLSTVLFENNVLGTGGSGSGAGLPQFEVWVDNYGFIKLPKVGPLKVSGYSQKQLNVLVQDAYKDIINNPYFDVRVSNLRVKITGAVNRQGLYYLERENQTLGELISLAGGVNFDQMGKNLYITRKVGDSTLPLRFKVSAQDLANPMLQNIVLQNNDIVYVQPSKAAVGSPKVQRITAYTQPLLIVVSLFTTFIYFQNIKK